MEANLTSLYVDSMDNAVLCKRMFNGFYKFDSLNIEAKNVEEIEADFLNGQQIYKCLRIVNGRIRIIKQNHIQEFNGDGLGPTSERNINNRKRSFRELVAP
jgi:hypothetical protein